MSDYLEYNNQELPYTIERNSQEPNVVARIKALQNHTPTYVDDDDVQEKELRNSIDNLQGKYLSTSSLGTTVAPLNAQGKIDSTFLPPSSGGTGIATLSLAGIPIQAVNDNVDIPITSDTCAGLLSCENKAKLDSIDTTTLATKQELLQKTDKKIVGTKGTAEIFNEKDGGGALFTHNDGTVSYVGVADEGSAGINAQIYAKNKNTNIGSRLDIKTDGIYYTVGNQSATARDVAANKLATIGDLDNKLTSPITVTQTVGGVSAGTTFPTGTTLMSILTQILSSDSPTPPSTEFIYYSITNNVPTLSTIKSPGTGEQSSHESINTSATSYTHGYNNSASEDPQYFSFAYPSTLGNLVSILDPMNAEQLTHFTKITDGGYNIYYIGDMWAEYDMTMKFYFSN